MDMNKKSWVGFLRRKQYVIAGAVVVIAAIGTTIIYSNNQEKERQRLEAELAREMDGNEEMANVQDTEETKAASALVPPKTSARTKQEKSVKEEESTEKTEDTESTETMENVEKAAEKPASAVEPLHFQAEQGLMWPMQGDVIIDFSMDSTVYFATLDQYKYNPAIIIAGNVNDKVYSAARGQIQGIENDEVTGCTVTVNLGDGYQAIYGQLKELNFEVGDYVEAGHVIGYISEPTKYYSVEGSNLYFELLKDGVPVNPVEYFG